MFARLNISKSTLLLSGILFLFVILVWDRLFQDFWSDEIYTLKHFVIVPLSVTLTDYHVPNNHIFFSAVLNLYSTVIQVNDLRDVFHNPYLFRLWPLVLSLGSIITTYHISRLISNSYTGVISSSILVFTLTFYEFGLQLRGYSLSIFLVSLIVYYSLVFIHTGSYIRCILITVLVVSLGYTIPLNYLFLLVLFLCVLVRALLELEVDKDVNWYRSERYHALILAGAIAIGVFLSLLIYLPIIDQIFGNQYVESQEFNLKRSFHVFYLVCSGFLSRRTLLLILILVGGLLFLKKNSKTDKVFDVYFLSGLFVIPFVISAMLGIDPPPRAFVNLLPIFATVVGVMVYRVARETNSVWLFIVMFCVYGLVSFHYERHRLSHLVQSDLQKVRGPSRAQELNYGYYSYAYFPLKEIENFQAKRHKDKPLVIGDAEPNGLSVYLGAMNIEYVMTGLSIPDVDGRPWEGPSLTDLVQQYSDGFYFVTRFKNRLYKEIVERSLRVNVDSLSESASYHNFFYIKPI